MVDERWLTGFRQTVGHVVSLALLSVIAPFGLENLQAQDAPNQHRAHVVFECKCNDDVGRLYATAFRDVLAKSPRFIEAYQSREDYGSVKAVLNLKVVAVSLDPSNDNPGGYTALSVVILLGDSMYLTQTTLFCSKAGVEHCASSTLADVDQQFHELLDPIKSSTPANGAGAAGKNNAPPWQDAVLTGFSDVATAASCDASGTAKPNPGSGDGSYSTESSASCSDVTSRHWTITFGGHTFVIVRDMIAPGIVGAFVNKDVLRGLTPGTHILAWGDGREIHVAVGGKVARYNVVQAQ
jgi:hypothetical protein